MFKFLTHFFQYTFPYHLKTSENSKVFSCFQGAQKGNVEKKWINMYN